MMPTPIFVLGKHRSGTTWVANQLCEHSLIAGVQHEEHFGIHESAYFSRIYNRYGDLGNRSNFVEFVEATGASDYFRLAGATKEFLYSLWPTTYEDLFRSVMDRYAERQGAMYWLEKSPSHSVIVGRLARFYPDAKFVSVFRNLNAVVVSALVLESLKAPEKVKRGRSRMELIARTVFSWSYYNRVLRAFERQSRRMTSVDYESLRLDLTSTLHYVCRFLDIAFEPEMGKQAYSANTSFRNRDGRGEVLSSEEERLVWLLKHIADAIPVWAFTSARSVERRGRRPLPSWFFLLYPHPDPRRTSHKPESPAEGRSSQSLPQGRTGGR
jgi:hypothetical protein